jgi:LmbE family N-acetylglucosaminyl deacetylase
MIIADPSKRYLFIFAHPDDDAFICGMMCTLLRSGALVSAVWATSGDYFGQQTRREGELSRAMDLIGLDENHRHLLRFHDLGLIRSLPDVADQMTRLVREIEPTHIIVNAYEGGHPDHDCVNFCAVEASQKSKITPELYEFPLYNGSGPFYYWSWRINGFPPPAHETYYFKLTSEIINKKYAVMKTYAESQWMYMIPARLASPKNFLKSKGEVYRKFSVARNYTAPPHPGKINYERWFNFFMKIRYSDFRQAVERVQSRI